MDARPPILYVVQGSRLIVSPILMAMEGQANVVPIDIL